MKPMPGWWLREKAQAKIRKASRRAPTAVWESKPPEPELPEGPPVAYDPPPQACTWYQFCAEREQAYRSRGEPVAALVYWALRMLDYEEEHMNPCTEEGYEALCAYWNFKIDWYEGKRAAEERLGS